MMTMLTMTDGTHGDEDNSDGESLAMVIIIVMWSIAGLVVGVSERVASGGFV